MKLLIIGGSSFIGKNIIEQCANYNEISECYATRTHNKTFDLWAKKIGINPISINLTNPVNEDFSRFDTAIFLAGNSNHGIAADDPLLDHKLTTISMLNFLESFHGRLIYLSSAATYFGLKGFVSPNSLLKPTFAYGISKLTNEHYINSKVYSGKLKSATILRLYYSFGRYDKSRRLFPQLFKRILEKNTETFVIHGDGNSFMNPLICSFVADVLLKCALKNEINGTYDLCGNNNMTVLKLIHETSKLLGFKIPTESSSKQEDYPVNFYGSGDSILKLLNLNYPVFEKSVIEAFEWYKTETYAN